MESSKATHFKTILACSLLFNLLGIYVCNRQTDIILDFEATVKSYQKSNDDLLESYVEKSAELIDLQEAMKAMLTVASGATPATFTSYYIGDGSSTDTTSSGLKTTDFEINSEGWYIYQGKVVLAAATYRCLNTTTGACSVYSKVPEGYQLFSLRDEVVFTYKDKIYQGIVLDSCGACFLEHKGEHQRLDIFVAKKGDFKMDDGTYRRVN